MKTTIKKLLALVLAAVMTVSLVACGGGGDAGSDKPQQKPTPTATPETNIYKNTDIHWIKQLMLDNDMAFAIGYLGYYDGDFDGLEDYFDSLGLKDEGFSFVYEIPEDYYVEHEGGELYMVVPLHEESTVTVSEWIIDEYNDWQGEEGNVLYHEKTGHPVLVKCNVSEIVPNLLICIEDNSGNSNYYTPYISGMDGLVYNYLDEETSAMDISPYYLVVPGWGDMWGNDNMGDDGNYEMQFDISYITGSWMTTVYTEDERYLDGSFTFYDDGTMEFAYGTSGEAYDVYYSGEYYYAEDDSLSEDAVVFDLYLDSNNSEYDVASDIYTAVTFELNPYSDMAGMNYENGDLLFGNEYDSYFQLEYTVG